MKTPIFHNEAIDLLGRTHNDPKIEQFLSQMGINWNDIPIFDWDILNKSKEFNELGISINFERISKLKDVQNANADNEPYVLEDITFWGYQPDFSICSVFPILNLSFESKIDDVIAVLGEPTKRSDAPTRPVQWEYDGYKIVIHWWKKPLKMRHITYWLTDLNKKEKFL